MPAGRSRLRGNELKQPYLQAIITDEVMSPGAFRDENPPHAKSTIPRWAVRLAVTEQTGLPPNSEQSSGWPRPPLVLRLPENIAPWQPASRALRRKVCCNRWPHSRRG